MTVSTTGDGPVGTGPYADVTEHVPWVPAPVAPIVYPAFSPTDARAVEVYFIPLHFNLIPNPSFRTNADGWTVTPGLTLRSDSWIGQSVEFNSPGSIEHDKIWIGPVTGATPGGDTDWIDSRVSGREYTVSLFAKGTNARLRVSLYGYLPKDYGVENPVPEDTPSVQVHSPLVTVDPSDWGRVWVKTNSRIADLSADTVNFANAWWLVPRVEVYADGLTTVPYVLLSSFVLDPSEGPLCDYFDADMSEDGQRDDYIWLKDDTGNNVYHAYLPQRVARSQWFYDHMYDVIPVNRPVQIYYLDRNNAWDPKGPPAHELTGALRTHNTTGPSMVEVALNRFGDLANPLP